MHRCDIYASDNNRDYAYYLAGKSNRKGILKNSHRSTTLSSLMIIRKTQSLVPRRGPEKAAVPSARVCPLCVGLFRTSWRKKTAKIHQEMIVGPKERK
jgi:hypothetical protein